MIPKSLLWKNKTYVRINFDSFWINSKVLQKWVFATQKPTPLRGVALEIVRFLLREPGWYVGGYYVDGGWASPTSGLVRR